MCIQNKTMEAEVLERESRRQQIWRQIVTQSMYGWTAAFARENHGTSACPEAHERHLLLLGGNSVGRLSKFFLRHGAKFGEIWLDPITIERRSGDIYYASAYTG